MQWREREKESCANISLYFKILAFDPMVNNGLGYLNF